MSFEDEVRVILVDLAADLPTDYDNPIEVEDSISQAQAAITALFERVIGEDEKLNPRHGVKDDFGEDDYCGCVVCDTNFHQNQLRAQLRATIKGQHPQKGEDE